MNKNKGYANLRKGRHSELGFYYHIIISTQGKAPVFNDFRLARILVNCLKDSDESDFTETLSFVVMLDHIHWLFILKKAPMSKCIQRLKSQFSRDSGYKIWQQGFYDHGIRDDESLINVARYIVGNPIRADLVRDIKQYPHWDVVWL